MLPNEFPNHLIADHHFSIFLLIFEICNNTIYWITYTLNLISSSSHVPSCSPAPAATPGRPLLPSPCCHRQRLWAVTTSSPSPLPPSPPQTSEPPCRSPQVAASPPQAPRRRRPRVRAPPPPKPPPAGRQVVAMGPTSPPLPYACVHRPWLHALPCAVPARHG